MTLPATKKPPSHDDLPVPVAEGDLRDTFDVPLGSGRDIERSAASGPQAADAAGLFADAGPSRKRQSAAEARRIARRCTNCGGLVPQGMSICSACGTDQETGMRVGLEDDLAPPPPPAAPGPPLHISIIGTFCVATAVILLVFAAVQTVRPRSTIENVAWICLALVSGFGIYAGVEFIRGKSAKLLMLALSLGVVVNVMIMIALPLFEAYFADPAQVIRESQSNDLDLAPVVIKPPEERIDQKKIKAGAGVLILYAVLAVYLMSPPVKKYMSSRAARDWLRSG
jgi:hypothetical protein